MQTTHSCPPLRQPALLAHQRPCSNLLLSLHGGQMNGERQSINETRVNEMSKLDNEEREKYPQPQLKFQSFTPSERRCERNLTTCVFCSVCFKLELQAHFYVAAERFVFIEMHHLLYTPMIFYFIVCVHLLIYCPFSAKI